MYWTGEDGWVRQASMSGDQVVDIGTNLDKVTGVAFDDQNSRLYWALFRKPMIQSVSLKEGHGRREIVSRDLRNSSASIHGLCVIHGRLFWTSSQERYLQTQSRAGSSVRTLYIGAWGMRHLVSSVPPPSASGSVQRLNPCEGMYCSGICVLNGISAKCVN